MFKWLMFSVLILGLLVSSCEKSLEYQLSNQNSKVVMYAFPMPDSTLNIHGSYTTDILTDKKFDELSGMFVSVYENGVFINKYNYDPSKEWLTINDQNLQYNDQIKIVFELEDGDSVFAETIIPEAVPIIAIDTSTVVNINENNKEELMLKCSIEINDPSGIDNYYQLRVDSKTITKNADDNYIEKNETIEFVKEDKIFLARDYEAVLITDIDYQGTFDDFYMNSQTYKFDILIPDKYLNVQENEVRNVLTFHLYSLTKEYYLFLRTFLEEQAFREDPIYDQANVFSNVNNGLGVVAGLSVSCDSIVLLK